jgi:molybdopterin converting factor small subunit
MPVTIKLPTPLRRHAGQVKTAQVAPGTIQAALDELCGTYPDMRGAIFGADGQIKPFVRVFVGAKDIADLSGPQTAVADGDVISIVPPIAGA